MCGIYRCAVFICTRWLYARGTYRRLVVIGARYVDRMLLTTMTTVGYGDYSPQTGAARVLMFFCMSAHLFSLGAPQTAKLPRPWALATPRLAISEVFDEPRRRVSWGLLEVPPIGVLRDVSSKKPRRCMIAGLTVLAMPLAIVGSSFQEEWNHRWLRLVPKRF